jgi:hypothetical protein
MVIFLKYQIFIFFNSILMIKVVHRHMCNSEKRQLFMKHSTSKT